MNRTNVEEVCNAFSPANNAAGDVIFYDSLSDDFDLPFQNAGSISFTSVMAFHHPDAHQKVCAICWSETFFGKVNDVGQLTEIVELYHGDYFFRYWEFCTNPRFVAPPLTFPSGTAKIAQLGAIFLDAVTRKDIPVVRNVLTADCLLHDGDQPPNNVTTFIQAISRPDVTYVYTEAIESHLDDDKKTMTATFGTSSVYIAQNKICPISVLETVTIQCDEACNKIKSVSSTYDSAKFFAKAKVCGLF